MGLITNGVRDISEKASRFKWIRVSLDSSNPDEYKNEKGKDFFDRVINNLRVLSHSRNPRETFLGVGYVLTSRNISGLEELINVLDGCGVDYIYFRPVEEAPDISPSIDDMLNLKRELLKWTEGKRIHHLININDRIIKDNNSLPCVAHSLTAIIHADGTVNMCEKRRHDEICIGNVTNASFESVWNSEIRKKSSKKFLNSEHQVGCDVCRVTSFNNVFCRLCSINTREFI